MSNPIKGTIKHLADVSRLEEREAAKHERLAAEPTHETDMELIAEHHPGLKCNRCGRGPLTKRRQWIIADKRRINISTGEQKSTPYDRRESQWKERPRDLFTICRACWMKKFKQGVFADKPTRSRRERGWMQRMQNIGIASTGIRVSLDFIIDPRIIQGYREMIGASQLQFADALGINRMMLRRYESADSRIAVNCEFIRKLVDVSVQWPGIEDDIRDDLRLFALYFIYPNMMTAAGSRFEGPGSDEAASQAELLLNTMAKPQPETIDELYDDETHSNVTG